MSLDISFHTLIENYNVLQRPTEEISECLRNHPNLYKAALITNHIFRSVAMIGLTLILPFSVPVNMAICLAGSLFYRLTVETNCAYKFALPAFAGSIAIPLGLTAFMSLITGVAFASLGTLAITFVSVLPLTAYFAYIVLTVSYDVNDRLS